MLIKRKFSSSGKSRLRSFQLAPPSFVSRMSLLLPTRKPWSASVKATSKGLPWVLRSMACQGLDCAIGRRVVTQPLRPRPMQATKTRLKKGVSSCFIGFRGGLNAVNKGRGRKQIRGRGRQKSAHFFARESGGSRRDRNLGFPQNHLPWSEAQCR